MSRGCQLSDKPVACESATPRKNNFHVAKMPGRIEIALSLIFIRNDCRRGRPSQPKLRIVIADAALVLWSIKLIDEIECLSIVGKRYKAVRKALGTYIMRRFRQKVGAEALAKCGRTTRRSRIRS